MVSQEFARGDVNMVWRYKSDITKQRASLFENEANPKMKQKKLDPHGIL